MLKIYLFGKFRTLANDPDPTSDSVIEVPWIENETVAELVKRLNLPCETGEVFVNHKVAENDTVIPENARIALFPTGMSLLCGGQHLKGHGFITSEKARSKRDYWNVNE